MSLKLAEQEIEIKQCHASASTISVHIPVLFVCLFRQAFATQQCHGVPTMQSACKSSQPIGHLRTCIYVNLGFYTTMLLTLVAGNMSVLAPPVLLLTEIQMILLAAQMCHCIPRFDDSGAGRAIKN